MKRFFPYVAAIAGVIGVIAVFLPFLSLLRAKPGTVAFAEVVIVVLAAYRWGTGPAVVASICGVLAWRFFFLSPYFTLDVFRLSVDDATLLFAFVFTSIVVGQLAARARLHTWQTEADRRQIERLYANLQRENAERQYAEEQFRSLVESAPDAMVIVDGEGKIRIVNGQAEKVFGYPREELYGQSVDMLLPERYRGRHGGHRADYMSNPKARAIGAGLELYGLHKNGTEFPVDISLSPLRTPEGMLVTAAIRDISERKRAEAMRAQLAAIVESTEDAVIGMTLASVITSWNRGAEQLFGYTAEEIIGRPITLLAPSELIDEETRVFAAMRRGKGTARLETVRERKDGQRIDVSWKISPIADASGKVVGVSVIAHDNTLHKQAEDRIRYLAQHDALTGLPNRLLFKDRISQAIAQARRANQQVAVLFIDLDNFKHINDSLGHQVGDRLLRVTAVRLQGCVREGDSVARLGGDEFVISLPAVHGSDDAMAIADKVLQALREPFDIDNHQLHVNGSIGISLYPTDGETAEALMRAADAAMYHAKEHGRDNYQFFTPKLNEAAQRRLTIATLLHKAVQRDEFVLCYQPQIDLESGCIVCAEALIRWRQAGAGLMLPGEFIEIAEDNGLIVPIGEWVLRQACRQLKRWRDAGYAPLRMAVNVSSQQLRRPGFVEFAASVLRDAALPASALEMEVTEDVLMLRASDSIAALQRLAGMGICLTVDDFGTGQSSLAYLRRFPIHILKIDRSFVDGIGIDSNDTAISSAIIALAHSLHLNIVAEGVETAGQAAFLKAHGCVAAQGYYYSEAVSAEMFTQQLERQPWARSMHSGGEHRG